MQIRAPIFLAIVIAILVVSFVSGFVASTGTATVIQATTIVKVTTKTSYVGSGNATTLTEYIVSEGDAIATYVVSGTCTIAPGTVSLSYTTTTTYIQPTNITSYFNATISTVSSYTMLGTKSFTTTIYITNSNTSSDTTGCPVNV